LLVPADAEPATVTRALAHERVAEVRSVPRPEAVGLARRLAKAWGLPDPVGADLDQVTWRAVLSDLADLRRGETTLVVVERAVLGAATGSPPGVVGLVEVRVDADGWAVLDRADLLDGPGIRGATSG
jgi:hypothetical protein